MCVCSGVTITSGDVIATLIVIVCMYKIWVTSREIERLEQERRDKW